jgi:hypothetical protein
MRIAGAPTGMPSGNRGTRPTRRELLVAGTSATVVATVTGAGLANAANAEQTTIGSAESDQSRLYRLVGVELLMLFVYQHVLGLPVLSPYARRTLAPLPVNEEAHIAALSSALAKLGATAPGPPANIAAANRDLARRKVVGRLGQLKGRHDALGVLLSLERVVVGAYFVALLELESPKLINLAAQIMANDAQHEALIGEVLYHGDTQNAVSSGLVQGVQ